MKFGASTHFFRERKLTEALDLIAGLGYATAEIWMEHYWSSRQKASTIARHAHALGLGLTLHAASHDVNILSTNSGIRRESRRQVRSSIELGANLGASVVVVHPGSLSESRGDVSAAWQSLEEAVSLMDDWAKSQDLWVGLENMEKRNKEIFMVPEDLARLFSRPWRKVRLTLDLAHMQTHMASLSFLSQVRPDWICHIHLSDNHPTTTHLPLGKGQLPVVDLLEELATFYNGIVSLEGIRPGEGERLLAQNMAYLRDHGFAGRPHEGCASTME